MNNKIGRNAPCPCGSGRKYKKCCGDNRNSNQINSIDEYNLEQRTTIMYNAMGDIFCFNKAKEWKDIKKYITSDRIKEFYKIIATLWPAKTDVSKLFPTPNDNKLRALYIGRHDPVFILKNIVRYTLYTDEILVFSPFLNPWCIRPEHNPIDNPGQYKTDMLQSIAFMQELAPWIFSGHVKLIPDPGDFNYKLRITTWDMAKKRNEKKTIIQKGDLDEDIKLAKKRFSYSALFNAPEEYRRKIIKQAQPNISEKETDALLEHMKNTVENDPYTINESLRESGNQLMRFTTGANLEMGLYVSYLTGAYLYTDWKPRWREILSVQRNADNSSIWSPLTNAFQALDFQFLNNVSNNFACSLRKDGRLESFRIFLRKMWGEISKNEAEISNPLAVAKNFTDELKDEYQKAKVDWNDIDKSLLEKMGIGTVATSVGGAIMSGGMTWQIPAGGFVLSAMVNLLLAQYDRKRFRTKCPMSVFIDLQKKT